MYDFNPYQPPLAIEKRLRPGRQQTVSGYEPLDAIRSVAILLSIGGVLWGIFFALLIAFGGWIALIIGLPGYLVTYGYLYRAWFDPSPAARRVIWGSSLLVQGGWLFFAVVLCGPHEFLSRTFGLLCVTWWMLATIASALALWLDDGKVAPCKPLPPCEPPR